MASTVRRAAALAVVLALASLLVTGPANIAGAQDAGAAGCTFVGGFAAFRAAVGEGIVGACEGDQVFEQGADARQRTSRGSFFFESRRNRVIFRDSARTWISGASGIGYDVTVTGLTDGAVAREPVVAPAAAVLNLALLRPGLLGPQWTSAMPPRLLPDFTEPACSSLPGEYGLPSVQLSMMDQEHGRTAIHHLSAVSDASVQPLRPQLQRFAFACDGWIEGGAPGGFVPRLSLEPLAELGDEALTLKVESVQAGTGVRRTVRFGFVRYGGLMSTVMLDSLRDEPGDDLRAALEWLARQADERIREAARVLRG